MDDNGQPVGILTIGAKLRDDLKASITHLLSDLHDGWAKQAT